MRIAASPIPRWPAGLSLMIGPLLAGVWLLAATGCQTGDDTKCQVACHCRDDVQYRDAGYCDRDQKLCVSGYQVCEQLCRDDGGVEQLCSSIDGQPFGHVAPDLVCPGNDPHGVNCDTITDCRVTAQSSGAALSGMILLGLALVRRRRRRACD